MPRPLGPRRRPGVQVYGGTPLTLPQATTLPATGVSATAATLPGSVNPQGLAGNWWFVYGSTPAYGTSTTPASAGSGTVPVTVTTVLSGLTLGASYHFAVVIQTSAGTVYGADQAFAAVTSPPVTNAADATVPVGAGLDQPHFVYPFVLSAASAAMCEQDSQQDVFSCVRLILDCPAGAVAQLPPGFGTPDLTFSNTPLDLTGVISAIERWEPRAQEDGTSEAVNANLGQWAAQLTTRVTATDGALQ